MSRFQLRFIAILAGLVLAVVAASGVLAERQLREGELARLKASLRQRGALVRDRVAGIPFTADNAAALDAIADEAGRASDARVTLVGPTGAVVGDSQISAGRLSGVENHADRPEVIAARRGEVGMSSRLSDTVGRRMLYLAVPVGDGPRPAVVRLAVGLDEVDAMAADLRRRLLLAGALGLGAALLLSFPLSAIPLRPVRQIRDVVSDIADGKLERRMIAHRRDEIGEIAGSINRMAEQLREQLDRAMGEKEELEAVLASMLDGVLVLEAGRIALANPRARELLSAWGEIEGRRPLEVIRNAEIDEALTEAASSRAPVVREVEISDGAPRTLLLHATAFPPEGEVAGTVAVLHDVSEIRRVDQMRRDFVANASHELRTPLTSIRGFADTLLASPLSKEEAQPYLEVIVRNAERLGNLIDDLLTLSQIESRKVALSPTEVDVVRLSRTLAADLAPRLREAGLALQIVDSGAAPAWADRQAVEQVVSNLLDNAVKYTDRGGEIEVEIAAEPHRVRVQVRDTGIGIPDEDRSRIFERFYRVDRARSRALGGTGLGLSIVKHLVQAMGGDITVTSEPGRGSSFSFHLPMASAATSPANRTPLAS